MVFKLALFVLLCFGRQLVTGAECDTVSAGPMDAIAGAGAAGQGTVLKAARPKRPALSVNTTATISGEEIMHKIYLQKLFDRYVCHEFRENFKEAIERKRLALIAKGENEKDALSKAEKKVFVDEFRRIYHLKDEKGLNVLDTLVSGSLDSWSRYLKAHPHSIDHRPVPGTFNLLHQDPLLRVRGFRK